MDKIIFVLIGFALGSALVFSFTQPQSFGAATAGLSARQATSTLVAVGTSPSIPVAATSSNCLARIITTGASAVQLDFNGMPPTGVNGSGMLQAASTTVAYDGGIYGCGAVQVYSYAAQSIRVTETR